MCWKGVRERDWQVVMSVAVVAKKIVNASCVQQEFIKRRYITAKKNEVRSLMFLFSCYFMY